MLDTVSPNPNAGLNTSNRIGTNGSDEHTNGSRLAPTAGSIVGLGSTSIEICKTASSQFAPVVTRLTTKVVGTKTDSLICPVISNWFAVPLADNDNASPLGSGVRGSTLKLNALIISRVNKDAGGV